MTTILGLHAIDDNGEYIVLASDSQVNFRNQEGESQAHLHNYPKLFASTSGLYVFGLRGYHPLLNMECIKQNHSEQSEELIEITALLFSHVHNNESFEKKLAYQIAEGHSDIIQTLNTQLKNIYENHKGDFLFALNLESLALYHVDINGDSRKEIHYSIGSGSKYAIGFLSSMLDLSSSQPHELSRRSAYSYVHQSITRATEKDGLSGGIVRTVVKDPKEELIFTGHPII